MHALLHRAGLLLVLCGLTLTAATAETPALSEEADVSIQSGISAAARSDYPSALAHFERARDLAPVSPLPLYYLGLAEANIPGRELRAICWFKAYLAAVPGATNAPEINATIARLKIASRGVMLDLARAAEAAAEAYPVVGNNPVLIGEDTGKDKALLAAAGLWARAGEIDAAFRTTGHIIKPALQIMARIAIARAVASAGDPARGREILQAAIAATRALARSDDREEAMGLLVPALADLNDLSRALALARGIEDAGIRCAGLVAIVRSRITAGDFTAAELIANDIPVHYYRSTAQAATARGAAESGDKAVASRMLSAARASLAGVNHDENDRYDLMEITPAVALPSRPGSYKTFNGKTVWVDGPPPPPKPPRSVAETNDRTYRVNRLILDCFVAEGVTGVWDRQVFWNYTNSLFSAAALHELCAARARAGDVAGADAVIDQYIAFCRQLQRPGVPDYVLVSRMNAAVAAGFRRMGDNLRARQRLAMGRQTISMVWVNERAALRDLDEVSNPWLAANQYLLNDPVFTDLPGHLRSIPQQYISQAIYALVDTARMLADAQAVIFALRRPPLEPRPDAVGFPLNNPN